MGFPFELVRLHRTFGDTLYEAAQRLVERGCVSGVRVLQSGAVITGMSADAATATLDAHRVYIKLRSDRSAAGDSAGEAAFDSECNCDDRAPCVHAAAVLIVASTGSREAPAVDQRLTIKPSSRPAALTPALSAPRQQLYYLLDAAGVAIIDGFRISVWVGQSDAGGRVQPESVCLFSLRNALTSASTAALPRYVDEYDRVILRSLAAQSADGPWTLRNAEGAALIKTAVSTGRTYFQALRGEPLAACTLRRHDALATASDTAAIVQPPQTRLRGKLTLTADLKAQLQFIYNQQCFDSLALRFSALTDDANTLRVTAAGGAEEIERDRDAEARLQARLDTVPTNLPQDRRAWLAFMLEDAPVLLADGWEVAPDAGFPYRIVTTTAWYADLQTQAAEKARPQRRAGHTEYEWFDLKFGVTLDGNDVNLLPALVSYLQTTLDERSIALALHGDSFHRIGEQLLFRLDDGRYLPVPVERIRRIADTLVELLDGEASLGDRQSLSMPASQASRLVQLAQSLTMQQSEPEGDALSLRSNDRSLLALLADLKDFSGIQPLPAPAQCQAVLRPYQAQGLGWLQFLRRYRLGGVLADDMGLGKTVQTLAHLVLEQQAGRLRKPALIVAPVSVIGNWRQEIRRFAPGLRLLTLHGNERKRAYAQIDAADVLVTGYPQLLLDRELLLAREFSFLVLDEAQMIKNPRAKISQVARELHAEHRLCLTGTPMENHLGELWSLIDFAQPGLLGDERSFQRHYRTPIEKHGSRARAEALARRTAPFILRRTKDLVASDLPPRTQIVESILMEDKQRDLYDSIRLAMHRRLREVIQKQGLARSQITVLDALLKLRQVCCDPRLVRKKSAELANASSASIPDPDPNADASSVRDAIPSAKMDWLMTVLPELVAEGRRILLFSQFTAMLRLIETAVAGLSIPYLMLTGATRERTELVARFQAGEAPLFLISLKAGGTGLNLTAADTVIHYDPWWNPAVQAQATDRAHRIGQGKPVFVYELITQGTVEEKILQLQADKQSLASGLYSRQNAAPTQLSSADLDALFAP